MKGIVATATLIALIGGLPLRAVADPEASLDRVTKDMTRIHGELDRLNALVERGEMSSLERSRQRYSEAETQFLLENYDSCAALLQDVVDDPLFKGESIYPQALYYLGESLYQIESYLESRRHFRDAVARMKPGRQFQDSIIRLIDLSERTNDFQGLDQYYQQAMASGSVRAEVTYLFAKWTARRKDLPLAERIARADADFARIPSGQPYYAQAVFFRGALAVQAGRLDNAAGFFSLLIDIDLGAKPNPKLKRLRDLGHLALARVLHDQGKLEEAAKQYAEVNRDSPDYNDALFESAATYVRMGKFDEAVRTADILLIVGRESAVAPDVMVLQANLHLRQKNFEKATGVFNEVVSTYGRVRNEVKAAIVQSSDPVAYFDQLLKKNENFDIVGLLPVEARPFVQTSQQVAHARAIAGDLDTGRKVADESQDMARRLLDKLATGNVSMFPNLQEVTSRAVELTNSLVAAEAIVVPLEVQLLGENLSDTTKSRLRTLDDERAALELKFRNLPKTQSEYEQRRAKYVAGVTELEKKASELRIKIQEVRQQLIALQLFWNTAKVEKHATANQDFEMQERFKQDVVAIEQLEALREEIMRQIRSERSTAGALAAGGQLEDKLREQYRANVLAMEDLVRDELQNAPEENRGLLARLGVVRRDLLTTQTELSTLRGKLALQANARAEIYRKRILEEQAILDDHQRGIRGIAGETGHLLGQIAYESFAKVERQFYDIVLKADVGIVDVAWARKRGSSDTIASLAKDKDTEIKALQEQYREVLTDAD